jgi:ubiquinone biosynthesis protein
MHPGNIFVSYKKPHDPQYICIDFGIVGTLDEKDQRYLAGNLLAFFNRDYRKVAQLHIESGWIARDTRVQDFESAIRMVCEPIFGKPLKDISFGMVIMQLFQVARRFKMEVQPKLILLQKTLLAIEGLGRQLYPQLDLWATAKPFLENWLREQLGPKSLLKNMKENLPFLVEQLPHMPRLLNDVLVLNKELQLSELENSRKKKKKQSIKSSWYKGLGIGIFTIMLGLSALIYLDLLPPDKIITITMGAALAGGFIAFLNNKKVE